MMWACQRCGTKTEVYETRTWAKTRVVYRRRVCPECGQKITTWETELPPKAATVIMRAVAVRHLA